MIGINCKALFHSKGTSFWLSYPRDEPSGLFLTGSVYFILFSAKWTKQVHSNNKYLAKEGDGRQFKKSFFKWPVTTAQGEIFGLILKLRTSDVHKMYSISDLPCQLFYGMIWEERRKRKKRRGGENEEELEGIGILLYRVIWTFFQNLKL